KNENNEGLLKLFVNDSGIGIPEEKQLMIFESFTKSNDNIEKLYRGTGAGLAIIKALVELFEGNILLNSKLNKGTKFTIKLPIKLHRPTI
ncbi:MAG: hypothetical protein DRJ05_12050, partial [Bacteroidetes bacterium]